MRSFLRTTLTQIPVLPAFVSLVRALYYIDDSNGTIQYSGSWEHLTAKSLGAAWLGDDEIFNRTPTFGNKDYCHATIPFTGSGITIYSMLFPFSASMTIDGWIPTPYDFEDKDSGTCFQPASSMIGCSDETISDVQSSIHGNILSVAVIGALEFR